MKKLKLFPKIFIYTLALLLLITMLASGTIYLLAPMMGENSVLSEGTYVDGMSSAIRTAAIPRNTEIAHTILRSLPYTIAICIVVSLLCAYFFSKANCLPGGPSDTQLEYWEIDEFEDWMEQQRDQIQKLADNKDKSFYYKDDNGSYVCREWTQEDVDSLYEGWQDQLALMKEGYHFTKSMELSNGGIISGAFDPETWNAEPASAPGSTIITLPDGSIVDLGHFDTADAATKAVQEYLEQQVSSGNISQEEADDLLNNGSTE